MNQQILDGLRCELAQSPVADEWRASMEAAARILDELARAIDEGKAGDTPEEIAGFARGTAGKARSIVEQYADKVAN